MVINLTPGQIAVTGILKKRCSVAFEVFSISGALETQKPEDLAFCAEDLAKVYRQRVCVSGTEKLSDLRVSKSLNLIAKKLRRA